MVGNRTMMAAMTNSPMSRVFQQLPELTHSRRLQAEFKNWAIQDSNL